MSNDTYEMPHALKSVPNETLPSQQAGQISTEIARHMHAFMDEISWFHRHDIKLHMEPTETGWKIKFSVPEP